jgi:hypothetical protein
MNDYILSLHLFLHGLFNAKDDAIITHLKIEKNPLIYNHT